MSPPTDAEVAAALASLAPDGDAPDPGLSAAARRVVLIWRAKGAGASWAQVGSAMGGVSGPVAKRHAKQLARKLNGEIARMGPDA